MKRNLYNTRMDSWSSMPGVWMFKVVPWFIGFVFVLVICMWIGYAVIGVTVYKEVKAKGLHSIFNQVWNGPSENK